MTKPSDVRVSGPLACHASGFCEELAALGYTPLSAANQVRLMAHLSRWLDSVGLSSAELTCVRIEEFLAERRRAGYTCWLSLWGLTPLLEYLRAVGVVPEPVTHGPDGSVEELLAHYRSYLVTERGLAPGTVRIYGGVAALFLEERSGPGGLDLEGLTAGEVTRFVVAECAGDRVGSKDLVSALRSLLRFLHVEGQVPAGLAGAVPAVAGWRGTSLPKALEPRQVQAMLKSCDRRRAVGRRDYAILVVLARLGLRAGEASALGLDDVDWRRGEIVVRGKGDRHERLPLPADVGEALAGYLRRGRPRGACRSLFLRVRAPHGGLSPTGVKLVARRAGERAGLGAVGAHRLRHSAATGILRGGGSLPEVAQVLRHTDLATTAIYAKVDRVALSALVQPWPGGAA